MMRTILSLGLLVTAIAAVLTGTTAFLSDTESSIGNTFAAGEIDLQIDNESYYNGARNASTSWELADLSDGQGPGPNGEYFFFNFLDLKPDDEGEDTISLHVDNNEAWACMDVSVTAFDDNGCNEPESVDGDNTCGPDEGELQEEINFVWWADDGDNVLEDDEAQDLLYGPESLENLEMQVVLADSTGEGILSEGPLSPDETYYIGKAWCFGDLTLDPFTQDELGKTGENGPLDRGTGISCDGSGLDNTTQTDSAEGTISFNAIQARNGASDFQCFPEEERTTLTLVKEVAGEDDPTAWTLEADGPTDLSGASGDASVTDADVAPGTYDLSEVGGVGDYTGSNWSCVGGSQSDGDTVEIAAGDKVTCTITNFLACEATEGFADAVVDFDQGVRRNGDAIVADRSSTTKALGAPQSSGDPLDNPPPLGEFFSLGFDDGEDDTPNEGGWIVVEFEDHYIVDGPGNDLQMWEVTGGDEYPVEKVKVEVSQDGSTWFEATASADRDAEADLLNSGLTWARFVRLTDVSDPADFPESDFATADGYDLDAFSALNCLDGTQLPQD